jgi:hypothetical protein
MPFNVDTFQLPKWGFALPTNFCSATQQLYGDFSGATQGCFVLCFKETSPEPLFPIKPTYPPLHLLFLTLVKVVGSGDGTSHYLCSNLCTLSNFFVHCSHPCHTVKDGDQEAEMEAAMVWISVPQGPCVKGLVSSLLLEVLEPLRGRAQQEEVRSWDMPRRQYWRLAPSFSLYLPTAMRWGVSSATGFLHNALP